MSNNTPSSAPKAPAAADVETLSKMPVTLGVVLALGIALLGVLALTYGEVLKARDEVKAVAKDQTELKTKMDVEFAQIKAGQDRIIAQIDVIAPRQTVVPAAVRSP